MPVISLAIGSRLLAAAALLAVSFAAGKTVPIASVSSSQPFELHGVTMPVAGIGSWPVVDGDEIVATSAEAVVSFQDGSSVTLAPGSKLEIQSAGGRVQVRLLEGSMNYRLSESAKIDIFNRDSRQTGSTGKVSTPGHGQHGPPSPNPGQGHGRPKPPPISPSR
jgi:hypothetical protein